MVDQMTGRKEAGRMAWGIILIFLGLIFIAEWVFNINVPIVRTAFALLLIYFGVKVLLGGFGIHWSRQGENSAREAVFRTSKFELNSDSSGSQEKRAFTTVFGESSMDLTQLQESELPKQLEFDTVFGRHVLKIRKGLPLEVKTSTVFGSTSLPGKNISAVGTFNYRTPGISDASPVLSIDVNVVFGSFEIVEQ